MFDFFEWSLVRDLCQALIGLLGVLMAKEAQWVKDNNGWFIVGFVILTAIGITAGHINDQKADLTLSLSQDKLTDALRGLSDRGTEMVDLQKQNFKLQQELTKNAEIDKSKEAQLFAAIKAKEMKHREEFLVPLTKFIEFAEIDIRQMVSHQAGAVERSKPKARKWWTDVRDLLSKRCTPQIVQRFFGPLKDPYRSEFPTDFLNTRDGIIQFYKDRIEVLEPLLNDSASCNR